MQPRTPKDEEREENGEALYNKWLTHFEEKEHDLAIKFLHKAALKKFIPAVFELANLYQKGELVPKDVNKALSLYGIGAQNAHLESIYQIALIYEKGDEAVTKKPDLAEKLFRVAAEHGHEQALARYKHALIPKVQINSLMLAMKYKDSLPLFDLKEEKNSSSVLFQMFIKAMLLGYGSVHSAPAIGPGLFNDAYHREALGNMPNEMNNILGKPPQSNLFNLMTDISRIKSKNSTELRSLTISDMKSTQRIFGPSIDPSLDYTYEIVDISGRWFSVVHLAFEYSYTEMKKALSHAGQFPPKDAQLWIVASSDNFKDLFINLFLKMNPTIPREKFNTYLDNIPYKPSEKNAESLKENILQLLFSITEKTYEPQHFFYIKLFVDLIKPIDIKNIKEDPQKEQARLSFSRLEYILNHALKNINHYELFLSYLEYAFDEINFLNALPGKYKKEDINQTLAQFIQKQYLLQKEDVRAHILLGGSGMNVLSNLITTAISEVKEDKDFKSGGIYVQTEAYFEIPIILSHKLGQKIPPFSKELAITFDKTECQVEKYDSKHIMSIIICAFQENVSFDSNAFNSKNVYKLIEEQLQLRKQLGSDEKLIAVIDTTINAFDDSHMSFLLMSFEDEIKSGKLAILTGHSFNKYFHLGFDKMPAGFSAGFYNPDNFPKIAELYTKEWLGGYVERDPTPQMITHLIQYATPQILEFHNKIKGNARYIHEVLLPKSLLNFKNPLIFIHTPYTPDIYRDVWGFLVIKINSKANLEEIGNLVTVNILKMFPFINIKRRDGYGYAKTIFTIINMPPQPPFIRLSIGTETISDLEILLNPLFNYLVEVNEIIEIYWKKMPEKCKEEILKFNHKLLEKLQSGKKDLRENKEEKINKTNPLAHDSYKNAIKYHLEENILSEAIVWYRIAAHQNHIDAIYQLAQLYEYGAIDEKHQQILPQDPNKAIEFYTKAIHLGHPNAIKAMIQLGISYEVGKFGIKKDPAIAVKIYEKAASLGSMDATFRLGVCYLEGIGLEIDFEKATDLFRTAADENNLNAKFQLANCYQNGLGVDQDEKEARNLLLEGEKLFIEKSSYKIHALFKLADLYEKGKHFPRNEKRAVELYLQAAKHDHVESQYRLGLCFKNSIGVQKDNEAAMFWLQKAAQKDHIKAKKEVEAILKNSNQSITKTFKLK